MYTWKYHLCKKFNKVIWEEFKVVVSSAYMSYIMLKIWLMVYSHKNISEVPLYDTCLFEKVLEETSRWVFYNVLFHIYYRLKIMEKWEKKILAPPHILFCTIEIQDQPYEISLLYMIFIFGCLGFSFENLRKSQQKITSRTNILCKSFQSFFNSRN